MDTRPRAVADSATVNRDAAANKVAAASSNRLAAATVNRLAAATVNRLAAATANRVAGAATADRLAVEKVAAVPRRGTATGDEYTAPGYMTSDVSLV